LLSCEQVFFDEKPGDKSVAKDLMEKDFVAQAFHNSITVQKLSRNIQYHRSNIRNACYKDASMSKFQALASEPDNHQVQIWIVVISCSVLWQRLNKHSRREKAGGK
jgi:hypothetical protein